MKDASAPRKASRRKSQDSRESTQKETSQVPLGEPNLESGDVFDLNQKKAFISSINGHLRTVNLTDVLNLSVFAFALTLAWCLVTFFSPLIHYSHRNDIALFNSVFGFSHVALALMLFTSVFLPKRLLNACTSNRLVKGVVAVVFALATVVLVLVEQQVFMQPYCSIASFIAGCCIGYIYMLLGIKICSFKMTQGVVAVFSSFVIASILFAIVVVLPAPVAIGCTILFPLVVGVILLRMDIPREEEDRNSVQLAVLYKKFSFRLILLVGLLSFAEGLVRSLLMDCAPLVSDGTYPWISFAGMVIATVLLGIPLFSTAALNFASSYKVAAVTLGFVFLMLPIVDRGTIPADLLAVVATNLLMMLVWIIVIRIVGRYALPAHFVVGIGLGVHLGTKLAGEFSGAVYASFFVVTPKSLSVITLISVGLVLISFLFLINEQTMDKLLNEKNRRRPKHFIERCNEVSKTYNLSPREEEIMILVVKGRSNPRIQEALGLTAGTVNSHLSHLYRKLGVHDKQSLIDLVENFTGE